MNINTTMLLLAIAIMLLLSLILLVYLVFFKKSGGVPGKHNPNLYGAITNLLIASIQKGQLPVTGLILLSAFLIYKTDKGDGAKIIHEVLEVLKTWGGLGWLALIVITPYSIYKLNKIKAQMKERIERYRNDIDLKEKEIFELKFENTSLKESHNKK